MAKSAPNENREAPARFDRGASDGEATMATNDATANQWLDGGAGSILRICDMLVELDRRNLIPSDMRTALVKHADELMSVLPNYIAASANLMAETHAEKALSGDSDQAAQVCWGIAFMTDTMNGMQYLARLERERQDYPEMFAAISKAHGASVSLVSGNA